MTKYENRLIITKCKLLAIATSKTNKNIKNKYDVIFEDGITRNNIQCGDFNKGHIGHPVKSNQNRRINSPLYYERIGLIKEHITNNLIVISDYKNSQKMTITYENGDTTQYQYTNFIRHNTTIHTSITESYKKITDKRTNILSIINNGQLAITTEYIDNSDITVLFEDNTTVKHKQYKYFLKGKIRNPNKKTKPIKKNPTEYKYIGYLYLVGKQNMLSVITSYQNQDNLNIMFCDETKKSVQTRNIKRKKVKKPTKIRDIHLDEFAFFHDGHYYYICSCPEWHNDKRILSIPQIYEITNDNRATAPREIS